MQRLKVLIHDDETGLEREVTFPLDGRLPGHFYKGFDPETCEAWQVHAMLDFHGVETNEDERVENWDVA